MIRDELLMKVMSKEPQSTNSIATQLNTSDVQVRNSMKFNTLQKQRLCIIEDTRINSGRREVTFRLCDDFVDEYKQQRLIQDKINFLTLNPQSIDRLYYEGYLTI